MYRHYPYPPATGDVDASLPTVPADLLLAADATHATQPGVPAALTRLSGTLAEGDPDSRTVMEDSIALLGQVGTASVAALARAVRDLSSHCAASLILDAVGAATNREDVSSCPSDHPWKLLDLRAFGTAACLLGTADDGGALACAPLPLVTGGVCAPVLSHVDPEAVSAFTASVSSVLRGQQESVPCDPPVVPPAAAHSTQSGTAADDLQSLESIPSHAAVLCKALRFSDGSVRPSSDPSAIVDSVLHRMDGVLARAAAAHHDAAPAGYVTALCAASTARSILSDCLSATSLLMDGVPSRGAAATSSHTIVARVSDSMSTVDANSTPDGVIGAMAGVLAEVEHHTTKRSLVTPLASAVTCGVSCELAERTVGALACPALLCPRAEDSQDCSAEQLELLAAILRTSSVSATISAAVALALSGGWDETEHMASILVSGEVTPAVPEASYAAHASVIALLRGVDCDAAARVVAAIPPVGVPPSRSVERVLSRWRDTPEVDRLPSDACSLADMLRGEPSSSDEMRSLVVQCAVHVQRLSAAPVQRDGDCTTPSSSGVLWSPAALRRWIAGLLQVGPDAVRLMMYAASSIVQQQASRPASSSLSVAFLRFSLSRMCALVRIAWIVSPPTPHAALDGLMGAAVASTPAFAALAHALSPAHVSTDASRDAHTAPSVGDYSPWTVGIADGASSVTVPDVSTMHARALGRLSAVRACRHVRSVLTALSGSPHGASAQHAVPVLWSTIGALLALGESHAAADLLAWVVGAAGESHRTAPSAAGRTKKAGRAKKRSSSTSRGATVAPAEPDSLPPAFALAVLQSAACSPVGMASVDWLVSVASVHCPLVTAVAVQRIAEEAAGSRGD